MFGLINDARLLPLLLFGNEVDDVFVLDAKLLLLALDDVLTFAVALVANLPIADEFIFDEFANIRLPLKFEM